MGLFNNTQEEKENIIQILNSNSLLDNFIEIFQKVSDLPWQIFQCGYYDPRKRTVCIGSDFIKVFSYDFSTVRSDFYADRKRYKIYSCELVYTEKGFSPIPDYKDKNGKVIVKKEKVIELWANCVRDKLMQQHYDFKFGNIIANKEITSDLGNYYFEYTVPMFPWNKWF